MLFKPSMVIIAVWDIQVKTGTFQYKIGIRWLLSFNTNDKNKILAVLCTFFFCIECVSAETLTPFFLMF